jgi:hypothetical protein
MKLKNFLIVSLILTMLFVPVAAMAQEKIVMKKLKSLQLCRDVHKILQMSENKGYFTKGLTKEDAIKAKNAHELFYIPSDMKDFKQIKWQPSSLEELKKIAPERVEFYEKQGASIEKVEKAILAIANNSDKRTVYFALARRGQASSRFLVMDNTINDSLSKTFNDANLGSVNPFYYQGRVYIAYSSVPSSIIIDEPFYLTNLKTFGQTSICYFELGRD